MAARSERNNLNTEERKIPVFTVLKNNAILKNIFIVNKPPEEPLCSSNLKFLASVRDHEDVLIVGRHPDCNIILTHPSISRFHLRIRSKPSSQELSVVDLSSVHGTWVSGRKLDPGVSVDLKEGDTFRIGGSSRVYRLHWIPISVAYDLENPFVSKLDVAVEEETRQEDAVREKEKVEIVQDEKSSRTESEIDIEGNRTSVEVINSDVQASEKFCSVDDEEIQSLDSVMDCTNSLLPDENLELTMKKEIPSVPPMVEEVISLIYHEGKKPLKDDHQQRKSVGFLSGPFETKTSNFHATSESEKPPHLEMVVDCNTESSLKSPEKMSDFSVNLESRSCMEQEIEAYPEAEKPRETKILNTLKEHLTENICLSIAEAVQRTKIQQFQDVIDVPPNTFTSQSPPGNPEASLEKHWFGLINPDTASLDQNSAIEMPKEAEFGWKLRNDESMKDISKAEAGKLITECMPLPVEEAIPETKLQQVEIVEDVTTYSLSDKEKQNKFCPENEPKVRAGLSAKYCQEQGQSMDEIVQDIDNKHTVGINPVSPPAVSINSSLPDEGILEIKNKKENQSPLSLAAIEECSEIKILESHVQATEKNLTSCNVWSRRGKAASAPQIGTSKSSVKGMANVDTEVQMSNEKDIVNKATLEDFYSVLDEGEETFAPDKENFSPNTLQLRFQTNNGKLEEIKHSKSQRFHYSKVDVCANIYPDECMSPTSNKENQTPKVAQEQNTESRLFCSHIKLEAEQDVIALKNRAKSVPIQSLLMYAPANSRSETSGYVSAAKNINASNCGQILNKQANPSHISGERKMRWDMVVDPASLVNKESRKALQLLQGLKGIRLIIPKTVIRELDIMKQQSSIFRRTSEASLVLEWIEECMEKSKWWIHVQSLTDEEKLTGLTPPAPPQTQSSEQSCTFPCGIGSSRSLSFHKNLMDSVSSTDEDYILDCALQYRTKLNNGQLVLLSDNATLKIKSMAEGLLCETVQEFRESLVNPFSQRFLWANSSARGLTWSCQDDVVLREKYCRFPLRNPSKGEGASGLKLILLHNSEYMGRPVQTV